MGSIAHIEELAEELDSQQTIIEMVTNLFEDFWVALDVVRTEIADLCVRVNLTMREVGNQAPPWGAVWVQFNKIKTPEPKPLFGVREVKALEKFIFDLEQYFKATGTLTEESKVMMATMRN